MQQVYDTPDGLEVALQLSTGDIEVEVRPTPRTTTVEIDGYDKETPPRGPLRPVSRAAAIG